MYDISLNALIFTNLKLAEKSLFVLSLDNPLRKGAIWLAFHPWFERAILLLIFLNSVVLGMSDYRVVNSAGEPVVSNAAGQTSFQNAIVENTELFFTIAFTVECFLKIVSLGLILSKKTYLRDWWNILDFVVVVSG